MSEWFVFHDTPYYPEVVNEYDYDTESYLPIVADTVDEAFKLTASYPVNGDHYFAVQFDQVTVKRITGIPF